MAHFSSNLFREQFQHPPTQFLSAPILGDWRQRHDITALYCRSRDRLEMNDPPWPAHRTPRYTPPMVEKALFTGYVRRQPPLSPLTHYKNNFIASRRGQHIAHQIHESASAESGLLMVGCMCAWCKRWEKRITDINMQLVYHQSGGAAH